MKTKIITTNKGEILVVELPKGAFNAGFNDRGNLYFFTQDDRAYMPTRQAYYNLPKRNWQPLTFDEGTAEKIVDYNELNDEFLGRTLFYRKYPDELHENFVNTALESLQSLIDANVFKENPYPRCECKLGTEAFEKCPHINNSVTSCKIYEKWQEAEESVFHNPHYFFKLK